MTKIRQSTDYTEEPSDLFDRVVLILEQARSQVVRSANHYMVLAYWQVGKEIVQEQQQGRTRADYGKRIIESLSDKLTARYGRAFSTTNLKYFRTFYLAYAGRSPEIGHLTGGESPQGFHPNLTWSSNGFTPGPNLLE